MVGPRRHVWERWIKDSVFEEESIMIKGKGVLIKEPGVTTRELGVTTKEPSVLMLIEKDHGRVMG